METVFNHNITPVEWNNICGLDREQYLDVVDYETARRDIAALYNLRGDDNKAEAYLNGLPPDMVHDFWRTVKHP